MDSRDPRYLTPYNGALGDDGYWGEGLSTMVCACPTVSPGQPNLIAMPSAYWSNRHRWLSQKVSVTDTLFL